MAKQSAREILREKLEELQRERAICSDAAQKFMLRKQIEDVEAELEALSGAPRRRLGDGNLPIDLTQFPAAEQFLDRPPALAELLDAAREKGLLVLVPVISAGTTGALTGAGADATPLPDQDLVDALSQQTAKDLRRIRERYMSGDRAAAIAELDALLALPARSHLPASLRGRLLRTAALYRLDFGQDQGAAEALAERAAVEDPNGDGQVLATHLARRRGDRNAALEHLEVPRSPQARHLKAAMLIEDGDAEEALGILAVPAEVAAGSASDTPPQADPTDAADNTAETWRLRALAYLVLKRLPDAAEAMDAACALAPSWIAVRSAAALIDFWRVCTSAALTLTEQPLRPMPFARALVRADADASARLAEIERTFAMVADAMPAGSDEQGHWLTWRLIALLAAGDQGDTAAELARRLIDDDGPLHIWPLLWSRFFGLDIDRVRLKERLKSIPVADPNFIPFTGLYLELRLEDGEAEGVLAELEEITPTVEALGHPEVPRQWRVIALTAAARHDEAGAVVDTIADERLRLRMRLHIARSQETERPDSHKAAAAALFAVDPSLDVLAEACDAHARVGDWAFVAAHADALLDAIPTPGSLRVLVIAAFNRGEYRRCMSALDEHRDVYPDGRLPGDLAVLRVRCQRMLGESSQAAREARRLWERHPTAGHLFELIDTQIHGGDLAGARESLRRMLSVEGAAAESLLRGANLAAVAGDRELAVLLWRRAGEIGSDAADFSGAMVITGSHLGLGRETEPWLQRIHAEAQSGVGSAKAVEIPEILDLMREQREAGEHVEGLYRRGQVPVHLLPEHLSAPLSRRFHAIPERNWAECDPLLDAPVLVRHGARPLADHRHRAVLDGRLVLDITAVLTACDLGLLDVLETHLAPLWLTPDWHLILLDEIRRLRSNQPDRIEAQRRVSDLVRAHGIARVDLGSRTPPPESLSDLVGEHDARALDLARANRGCLVASLLLTRAKKDDSSPVPLPRDWSDHLIGPRGLLDQAASDGLIDAGAHRRGMQHFPPEPDGARALVRPGDYLLVCPGVLIALAQADVLSALAQGYRLAVADNLWEQIDAELSQNNADVELITWLQLLIDRLSAGRQAGTYQNAPSGAPPSPIIEQPTCGLDHLLNFPGEPGDLLWIDDRLLSGYPQSGVCQVIGVVEVLELLHKQGAISRAERFGLLHRLRASNYRFIPLDADEILYWLRQVHSQSDRLIVPAQLDVLARYWAACLYQGEALQWTGNDHHGQGEIPFFVSSQSAVSKVLCAIWSDERLNPNRRRQRADWVLDNLYVGVGDIPHLGLERNPERDMSLVGMDQAGLCFGAFQVMVERIGRERKVADRDQASAKRERDHSLGAAAAYLSWICERVVAPRLLADPTSAASTAAAFRSLLLGSFARDDGEFLPLIGSWLLRFLPILPSALREELHKDQDLMQRLGLEQVDYVAVDGLHFRVRDLWPAVQKALRGARPILLDSEHEQPFSLSPVSNKDDPRPVLELTDADGTPVGRHHFQFSELLFDGRELRIQALRSNPHWWDGDRRGAEAVERDLCAIDSAASRVREIRRIMDSSADAHYIWLEEDLQRELRVNRGLSLDRSFPPSLSAVLTYIRCPEVGTDGKSLAEQCWDTLFRSIPPERSLAEQLCRIALLPCALPDDAHRRVAALDMEPRRELLKLAAREMTHTVGHLHLIDLLLASAASLPEALDLAQEQIAYLSTSHFADELKLTRPLVDLAYRAFGTEAEASGNEPRLQLLAAWVHAGRVTGIARRAGVNLSHLAKNLKQWAPFPYRDLYAYGQEPTTDMAWPWHVAETDLIFDGLGRS